VSVGVTSQRLGGWIKVGKLVRHTLEPVTGLRDSADEASQRCPDWAGDELVGAVAAILLGASVQLERRDEGVAEADVDQVGLIKAHFEAQVIEGAIRPVEKDRSTEVAHLETQRSQQRSKGTVQLETPATPRSVKDLRHRPFDVGANRSLVEDVEVLKRDSNEVRSHEVGQRCQIERTRSLDAKAMEVASPRCFVELRRVV